MQSKRPIAKPIAKPATKPTASELPELDLGEAEPAKPAVTVSTTTTAASADAAAIDAQLDALATRTTVEDLARRGKKNLKTLSERQLKEWIREALRRVISTTTSVGSAEQERMLAATRAELSNLMGEAGNSNAEREALEAQLAQLRSDRDVLAVERDNLLMRLADLEKRLDDAASQLADAELSAAGEDDVEDVEALRAELGTAYARLSASENERAGLQKTLGARLVASSEVAAAVLELDRTCYAGLHLQSAQSDAAGDTAAFYADETAARAAAEALVGDLTSLRAELAAAAPGITDETLAGDRQRIASLAGRTSAAADPVELATALRERDEARNLAETAKRTVARLIAQADPQAAQNTTARISRAELGAKQAAERLAQIEAELAVATHRAGEAEAARQAGAADNQRLASELSAQHDSARAAAGRAETLSGEVARLTRELVAARADSAASAALAAERDRLAAVARAAEDRASAAANTLAHTQERLHAAEATARRASERSAPTVAAAPASLPASEPTPDRLSHADGAWRWSWSDGDNLRLASFHGAWGTPGTLKAGAGAGVLHLADGAYVAWRDASGQGRLATPQGLVHELGPVIATPGLARGNANPFVGASTPDGVVQVIDADGLSEELSSRIGCPAAVGAVSAWWWAQEDSRHLAYRDAQGAIHELLELDGTWYHASLTGHTGCPAAAGDPLGYAPGDHEHVLFRAHDGHIHELCFHGERWLDHDLTALSGAPAASGQPSGAFIAGRHHVAFRAADGSLHLLRLGGDWRHTALPRLGGSDSDPFLASSGEAGALAWQQGGRWQWARFADEPANASAEALPT